MKTKRPLAGFRVGLPGVSGPSTSTSSPRSPHYPFDFPPSPEQRTIDEWVCHGSGSAFIEALAGTGKTSVLLAVSRRMSGSVAFTAFNRAISDEVKGKITRMGDESRHVRVGTFHSFGYAAWRRHAPNVEVDAHRKHRRMMDECSVPYHIRSATRHLVSLGKQSLVGVDGEWAVDDYGKWGEIIDHYSVLTSIPDDGTPEEDVVATLIYYAGKCIEWARKPDVAKVIIDYDDMLWLPLLENVPIDKFQWLLVDECFLPDTPILLDDEGNWMTIGEMVEYGYSGTILSYDEATGQTCLRRVTGYKKVMRDRPMKQIRFLQKHDRWAPLTRKVKLGVPIVVCTEDHKIWTSRGWTAARDLEIGDTVLMETAQGRVASYQDRHKISAAGKKNLAPMGNKRGLGSRAGSREHFNRVKGGNGRGPSACEVLFAEKLKMADPTIDLDYSTIVATGKPRGSGYPNHYKVDYTIPSKMVAIEIDGNSHTTRRDEDERKEGLLVEFGYRIVRFRNVEVKRMTPQEVYDRIFDGYADCLVEAEIVEVNDYMTAEQFVYDIEVEGTHCYFAHGLLVHNCQDSNAARRTMMRRMLKDGGRLVGVGDRNQAIYGFSGATANAVDIVVRDFQCTVFPLTVTFRCSKAATRMAQTWVPEITAAEGNEEGAVYRVSSAVYSHPVTIPINVDTSVPAKSPSDEAPTDIIQDTMLIVDRPQPGDAVLCRNTKPIVSLAFRFIREGIPAHVEGRDIGKSLDALASRWRTDDVAELARNLESYRQRETARLAAEDKQYAIEALHDRVDSLSVIMDGCETVGEVKGKIDRMFRDTESGEAARTITLATVHRSKGREWGRVFALGWDTLMPSRYADKDWEMEQERNLQYVCVTRAKRDLVLTGVVE